MADEVKNTNVISKHNSGFPDYLDFEKLRTEGIDHLGRLAGKIWTDHNVHDPGITILEALCYALLDLGYRTNLPAEDIFSRNPEDGSPEDNFFTPAQILSCNPLTVTDYRKLLIDIPGVRNAWLHIADDQKDICRRGNDATHANGNYGCVEYLNGLYHVSIELEENADEQAVVDLVRKTLMAHRNFCEDFVDIRVLCHLEVGVCVEVELEENADVESTFLSMAEKLQGFLNPAPAFYTLQQLLDKGRPIEDIFAGRPHNITASHGFVDTEEFLKLELKKEVHLSDVYDVLFEVPGVKAIRNLRLRDCKDIKGGQGVKWKMPLPVNHIPVLSLACSGFRFSKSGLQVAFDAQKYDALNLADNNGKILYSAPSPYLDLVVPSGVYRNDLADYYSIQNDFPKVYGIAEGGLPDTAPAERKAQALQLKGYLLFFDQLLANYLAQLQNIRALFALSASGNKEKQHTYFLNTLESVPDLNKLLRFAAVEQEASGKKGAVISYPVSKSGLAQLILDNSAATVDPTSLAAFTFSSLAAQDTGIYQLKEDLAFARFEYGYLNKDTDAVYYYLIPATGDFALLSKSSFKTQAGADEDAGTLQYIAGFDDNYRTFITANNRASFALELNLVSFASYLQLLIESKEQYHARRDLFLNHLLSRFAEKFTDFALLSYSKLSAAEKTTAAIAAKEEFLSHYDELSSNRGKGYDYLLNNWNNDNQSGFEKEVKYLAGIAGKDVHSLCNFVVEAYDDQYLVEIKVDDKASFRLNEKFDSRTEARAAATAAFRALSDPEALQARYQAHEQQYELQVRYGTDNYAIFSEKYAASNLAEKARKDLNRMFSARPEAKDVFISDYIYRLQLSNSKGEVWRNSAEAFNTAVEAQSARKKLIGSINNETYWGAIRAQQNIGSLHGYRNEPGPMKLVDVKAFKIDINNTIVGKPDKFTYDLLDRNNSFKLHPVQEFDTHKTAEAHALEMLMLGSIAGNFRAVREAAGEKYAVQIISGDTTEAVLYQLYDSEADAVKAGEQVCALIRQHEYTLSTEEIPHRWKYRYDVGFRDEARHRFTSAIAYTSPEEAMNAAVTFRKELPDLQLRDGKDGLGMALPKKPASVVLDAPVKKKTDLSKEVAKQLLEQQQVITRLAATGKQENFDIYVAPDEISREGRYVYRLVDKDNIPARYTALFYDANEAREAKAKIAVQSRNAWRLELYLGGDIIFGTEPGEGIAPFYHYQLKCRNLSYPSGTEQGAPLVLLESTTRYPDQESALAAFSKEYLALLDLASRPEHYGKDISLGEPSEEQESSFRAYVPKRTLEAMENSVEKLAAAARSYPIRQVRYGSADFYRLFPCEQQTGEPEDKPCCGSGSEERYVYYFSLYNNNEEDPQEWLSLKYYDTPEQAMEDFRYFLVLIKFSGNFYIDCDLCSDEGKKRNVYRIYIREVLAESVRRFETIADAWGKNGVEQFICAVQSDLGFRQYLKKENCCYSFYLNCGHDLLVHPCRYDTPEQRTAAMQELYMQFRKFVDAKSYVVSEQNGMFVLHNANGAPFAVEEPRDQGQNTCDRLMDLLDLVKAPAAAYVEKDGKYFLTDASGKPVLRSHEQLVATMEEWKTMISGFLCYFPISRKRDEQQKRDRYCLSFKLPGFNTCGEEDPSSDCRDKAAEKETGCYVAWQAPCCYNECTEVLLAYVYAMRLLVDFNNYRAIFDCNSCSSFGIALHHNFRDLEEPVKNRLDRMDRLLRGAMIAFNPQCYTTPEMVCRAVERTRARSNAEGLHVIEHILLRPHCEEDCSCEARVSQCRHEEHCSFTWKVPFTDPCDEQEDICFVPGADPYSFIATVVLPAWPERFRSPERKTAIENILYRTAPAHVLLRVLWLGPRDFCAFEMRYRQWRRWLAGMKTCNDNFSVCSFLTALFHRPFECMDDVCLDCQPCSDTATPVLSPCLLEEASRQKEHTRWFQKEINQVFCWEQMECDQDPHSSPPSSPPRIKAARTDTAVLTAATAVRGEQKKKTDNVAAVATTTARGKQKETANTAARAVAAVPAKQQEPAIKAAKPAPDAQALKSRAHYINSRYARYRTATEQVAENSGGNPLAAKVMAHLHDPHPSVDKASALVTELIRNTKPAAGKGKALNKKQVLDLARSVAGYNLDKICFGENEDATYSQLQPLFSKMQKAKLDTGAIYNYWDALEVKKYEPGLDIEEIRKLVTGRNDQ